MLGLLVVSAGCGRALEVPEDKLPETCVEDAHFVFGLTKKGVPANSAQLDDVASVILPLDGIWMVYTRNTVGQDRWLEATFSTPPMPGRIYSAVTHPAQPYDVTVRYNETVDGESVSYSSQKGMVSFGISKCSGQLRVLFSNVTVANARGSFALGGELSVFDFTQSGDRSCARGDQHACESDVQSRPLNLSNWRNESPAPTAILPARSVRSKQRPVLEALTTT